MEKLMKRFMIIGLLLCSFAAKATDTNTEIIAIPQNAIYKVVFVSEASEPVSIKIFHETKGLIFSEKISKTNSFIRPYNFSQLPEGNYRMELKQGSYVETKEIVHGGTSHSKVDEVVNAVILSRKGLSTATIIARPVMEAPIQIKWIDRNGRTLFEEQINESETFKRKYDFSKVKRDAYKIQVIQGNSTLAENYL